MARGCRTLIGVALATTATWPSRTPHRSCSGAWGFLATPPLSAAFPVHSCSSHRFVSWAAPSTERGHRCGARRPFHANAAFKEKDAHPGFGAGAGGSASLRSWSSGCSSCISISRASLALPCTASGGGGDRGLGGAGLDPESVARAREAAKNDDYDWFMEFIGGNEEDGDGSSNSSREDSIGGAAVDAPKNSAEVVAGSSSYARRATPTSSARRQASNSSNGRYSSSSGSRNDNGFMDESARGPAPRQGRPTRRGFQPGSSGLSANGRVRGERSSAPADTAYDYDLDEEFDQEPGRGGWDYDPGLSAGIGARRRGVEVDKVRAKTKPASMRRPLEDENAAERTRAEREAKQEAAARPAVDYEPISSEKANILTKELGYTEAEAACIDPDMAELAIERVIRRPGAGMPPDWVAVGMPPPLPLPPTSPFSSSQTYVGEGGTIAAGVGRDRADYVDGGALDLDAILGDGYLYDGGGGRRQDGTHRSRRREREEQDRYYSSQEGRGGEGRRDSPYYEAGSNQENSYFYDEEAPRRGSRGWYEGEDVMERRRREIDGDMGSGVQQSRRRRRKKEPALSPAERYERDVFGGPGGKEDDNDDGGKLWTGVGPDGPWPTMEEFTKLLREETEVRLSLVGPWAADVVALENRFRLQAYEKWLEILDKGIGQTLEEAGVFDAAFNDDNYYDEDNNDGRGRATGRRSSANNLYDDYTNYGFERKEDERGGGRGAYDPQRRRDDPVSDDLDRFGGEYGNRRQRARRPSGWDEDEDEGRRRRKFDVGSFLRSGAQSIMQPGVGMEEKAAQFERRYPGRTGSNVLGNDDQDDDDAAPAAGADVSGQRGGRRRTRREANDDNFYDVEVRGRRRGRAGDRGSTSPGYVDEEEYEY